MASGPSQSIQFSGSAVSDSLWPHELQHTRPPCPSPTPGVYSNSCPSSQWCQPAISSSVGPFSSGPILHGTMMWKQWKQWQTIFLGSKITAYGDCSHEIKRCLLLGSKAMTNWDSILKSRHIPLPTKVRLVKAIVFPVVMYGCESWTIKKAECWRIDDFELWCWRRLLRVSWTARRSNQPILKEISPDYSLEGLIMKLKLQSFGHLMGRTDSFEKILMLGKWRLEEKGTAEDEIFGLHHWLDGCDFEQDPGVGDGQGGLAYCSSWCCKESDMTESLNWTELNGYTGLPR